MALGFRQRKLYKDRVRIYRPIKGSQLPNGSHQDFEYELIAQNVPCHFFFTSEYAEAAAIGRTKVNNLFTFDKVHFPERINDWAVAGHEDDADIGDAYCLQLDYSESNNIGGIYIVQSDTLSVPSSGGRRANYQELFTARAPKRPKGVSA